MSPLNKAAILAAPGLATEDVEMPEWGGCVRVSELSAMDLLEYWGACRDDNGELIRSRVMSALLSRSVIDDGGAPLFSDSDISQLMAKSAPAVNRLFDVAQRLSGIGRYGEDAEKNSVAAPSGALPSASALPSA